MTGQKSTPDTAMPVPPSDQQMAPEQVPPQFAFSKATGAPPRSVVAQDESTSWSTTDLMKAAFGATLALAWAVFGAWLAMRRARVPKPLDEPAAYPSRPAYASQRAATCERMYDETRLVPQYLRSAEFPATKHDLVRLAREHADEGQALRRLECLPDRRYSSLHDLITEICVD